MVGRRRHPRRLRTYEAPRVLRTLRAPGAADRRPPRSRPHGPAPRRQDGPPAPPDRRSARQPALRSARHRLRLTRPAHLHAPLDRRRRPGAPGGERRRRHAPDAVPGRDPVSRRLGTPSQGIRRCASRGPLRGIGFGGRRASPQEHRIGRRPLHRLSAAAADVLRIPRSAEQDRARRGVARGRSDRGRRQRGAEPAVRRLPQRRRLSGSRGVARRSCGPPPLHRRRHRREGPAARPPEPLRHPGRAGAQRPVHDAHVQHGRGGVAASAVAGTPA